MLPYAKEEMPLKWVFQQDNNPKLEADIFSGIQRVTGIPRDGKQNRYESRDWDGTGKNVIGSGRDRE